ncbi:MAG: hypothetical protein KA515_02500 [Candidatus Pacebacteria bacterium]|nr:hypothetical protein [Candidatus Paceibacterota bacterium]
MKKTTNNVGKAVVIGAGVAALTAAGYFFFGPGGKKHQKKLKGWMIKMQGEVVEKMESAKEISEPVFHEIVDSVSKGYVSGGKATQAEVIKLARELKSHWKSISQKATSKIKKIIKK